MLYIKLPYILSVSFAFGVYLSVDTGFLVDVKEF